MTQSSAPTEKKVGSVFDLPAKSLKIVKENWKVFAIVNVLSIISAIFTIFDSSSAKDNKFSGFDKNAIASGGELSVALGAGIVVFIIFLAIGIFLYAMSTSLEVRASKGETPALKTIFEDGKKYWLRLFGLNIVAGFIVLIGLILLIVPGLIAIGRLVFSSYQMVDKDLGIEDSLKASNNMSKGRASAVWSAILLFVAIAILTGIVSAVPVIGPIVGTAAAIAYSLILVLRYRELKAIGA